MEKLKLVSIGIIYFFACYKVAYNFDIPNIFDGLKSANNWYRNYDEPTDFIIIDEGNNITSENNGINKGVENPETEDANDKGAEDSVESQIEVTDDKGAEDSLESQIEVTDDKGAEDSLESQIEVTDDKGAEDSLESQIEVTDDKGAEDSLESQIEVTDDKVIKSPILDKNNTSINKLEKELLERYKLYEEKKNKVKEIESSIPEIKERLLSLKDQIDIIDNQISFLEKKISMIDELIHIKKDEIRNILSKLKIYEISIEEERNKLTELAVFMYKDIDYFSDLLSFEKNFFKIILSGLTLAENRLIEDTYKVIEDRSEILIKKLEYLNQKHGSYLKDLDETKNDLNVTLKNQIHQKKDLQTQIRNKNILVTKTSNEEEQYTKLLSMYIKQEKEVKKDISDIENKIKQLKTNKVITKTESIPKIENLYELYTDLNQEDSKTFFGIWPVDPSGGITAYFHDPTYPFGVHNAIDIRQAQGSTIVAPATAYVYKVRDNGMGYSYLILAHRNNVLTVYGHVTEFLVAEGDLVHEGDKVAITGGAPGTKGAGWMTTGAHLHFEVIKDGKHDNPLNYLPLEMLPAKYVPDSFLKH